MGTEAWIWMGAWAIVMVLAVWILVREPHRETRDDPGAILRARFARGEISEEELRRASEALASVAPVGGVQHHGAHQGQEARHD